MTRSNLRFSRIALLVAFLALTAAVYLPGLSGGFLYDDWGSINGNRNVQVTDGAWSSWARAALTFPSGTPPFRSLTMLSFAANHYFSGLDPHSFKLTNVCIHLLNGTLLFLMLQALFKLWRACRPHPEDARGSDDGLAAAAIAGVWLLLPINLTAVLYSVQRLESFAATFVLLGLWLYLRSRLRVWEGRGGRFNAWLWLGLCTVIGLLAKETAAMLPLYAAVAEFCVSHGRNRDGKYSRTVLGLFASTLLLPLVVGLFWMWGRYIGAGAFSLHAPVVLRMLTEARVMFDYIDWTLVPSLDSLTLYHDDIELSQGLFEPVTTFFSLLAIVALVGAALWQRKRRPLFALGILWFFAGHVLTGTVVPLIIAFEHRNYFSSIGLLLALASLITLEGPLVSARARAALLLVVAVFYGGTTLMRAQEWSDPMRLAASEAMKRPASSAAQFDYAQALLQVSMTNHQSAPADVALKVLDRARHLPGASIHFEQGMITLLGESGYAAPADVWSSLVGKLRANPPDTNGIHALARLNHCFANKQCKESDLPQLGAAYEAALSHRPQSVGLLSVHAEYAWHVLDDRGRAEQDFRDALVQAPRDIEAQTNLIVVLIYQGKRDEAESMIKAIEARNRLGLLDAFIEPLRRTLDHVAAPPPPVSADSPRVPVS